MLTYKAMYKFLTEGVHAEVLDFPGAITCGANLEEARRLLASALVDMAETNLLAGEALPTPDPTCTDSDADLEEPIHLILTAASRVAIVPQGLVARPSNGIMLPFDSYPHNGKVPLGRVSGSNCRRGYGLKFMQKTGQTTCAYCGFDLIKPFENWLQMALDHVVPKSVCKRLLLPDEWAEDSINRVLACSACNGFDNRYKPLDPTECPQFLEAFCQLRDRIFADRKARIEKCRDEEKEFFQLVRWNQPVSQSTQFVATSAM